jgi:3-hydroxybutyryl-CoA dehydrogenase
MQAGPRIDRKNNSLEGTKVKDIQNVLVVGAGVMGHGLAQTFAMKDLNVFLVDKDRELLDRAEVWIRENLEFMVELNLPQSQEIENTLSRISTTTDLERSAMKADYVLEAISENLDLKKEIFKQLGTVAGPDVILATNTSSYDINELAAVTRHPERVLGTHWFHPPPITPAVEIIPADATSEQTIHTTVAFMEQIGKFPTMCKSTPGFVANRIQFAMAAEALAIVQEGLASPEEVDRIVKSSFGFRLSAFGPLEIIDQAGLDTYRAIFEYLHDKLGREQFKPPRILSDLIEQGRLGLKNEKGFYDHEDGAAEALKRKRDSRLYARLNIFKNENQGGEHA